MKPRPQDWCVQESLGTRLEPYQYLRFYIGIVQAVNRHFLTSKFSSSSLQASLKNLVPAAKSVCCSNPRLTC